jgi:hypothetical protein
MFTNDFWLGATWSLACIFGGVLLTLIFTAVVADREDPLPPDDDPEWEPLWPPDDLDAEFQSIDDLITHGNGLFEANLMERR